MPYLDQSKIALPKDETNYNTWADYFELFCLLHPDRSLSVEALKDRLIDENGGDSEKALAQIAGTARRLHIPNIDKIEYDEIDNDINDPETEQQIRTHIISVIQYMKNRQTVISQYYPFIVNSSNQILAKSSSDLTNKNKLYVILLLSSLIRIIQRRDGFAYKITHRFEELCRYPFAQLMPQNAKSIFFGAGGYIHETDSNVAITGSFFDKVEQIAGLLNLETTKLFTREEVGAYNNGDGGLDWLGYYSFDDNLSTSPIFFAQCACGNDWEDKMFDAHIDKWRSYITWINDYTKIHFIPKSFRNTQNKWLSETSIYSCTLVDRFRLIHLLEQAEKIDEIVATYNDILTEIETTSIVF